MSRIMRGLSRRLRGWSRRGLMGWLLARGFYWLRARCDGVMNGLGGRLTTRSS